MCIGHWLYSLFYVAESAIYTCQLVLWLTKDEQSMLYWFTSIVILPMHNHRLWTACPTDCVLQPAGAHEPHKVGQESIYLLIVELRHVVVTNTSQTMTTFGDHPVMLRSGHGFNYYGHYNWYYCTHTLGWLKRTTVLRCVLHWLCRGYSYRNGLT